MDRPVLMLDRDGTLNVPATSERYVTRPADIELMPGVAESLVETMVMDPAMVIITNQRGLATGAMTREEYVVVTSALLGLLKQHGISPELIVTCPHDRNACGCRKPSGAMLRAAMQELEAHPAQCLFIGDQDSDCAAAKDAGVEFLWAPDVWLHPHTLRSALADHGGRRHS